MIKYISAVSATSVILYGQELAGSLVNNFKFTHIAKKKGKPGTNTNTCSSHVHTKKKFKLQLLQEKIKNLEQIHLKKLHHVSMT